MTVGVKAKKLFISAIAMIVVCAILLVLALVFAVAFFTTDGEDVALFLAVCAFFLVFSGVLLGFYIPILVRLCRSPAVVIEKREFDFALWCGKDGSVVIPCDAVVEAKPVRVLWTASLITMLSDNYDATIQITTNDGHIYKVPYVQQAKQVCADIMRIAFEVRAQKEVLAYKAQKEREEAANAEITSENE